MKVDIDAHALDEYRLQPSPLLTANRNGNRPTSNLALSIDVNLSFANRTSCPSRLTLTIVAQLLLATGCARLLGTAMVSAPNKLNLLAPKGSLGPPTRGLVGIDQQFRVQVGPPQAELSVSVVEPAGFEHPRGTVLVLHGIWNESLWMLGTAKRLSQAGFRAVLVDLRGHGRSTGKQLTYGVREARDLSQVIDALEERRLIAGDLGVYGISYGATTAIHLAGRDRRIRVGVAVAPFSTMRDVVPDYARTVLTGAGTLVSSETLQQAVDVAGSESGFDPDLADAIAAIQNTAAPILIVHGTDDWLVPPYHALRLHEAAKDHSELVLVPRTGHIKIWFDPTSEVADKSRQWFERWLAGLPTHASDPAQVR